MTNRALWDRVCDLLTYEPALGFLFWRRDVGSSAKAGEVAGWLHNRGYWAVSIDGRNYLAHRVAWLITTGGWPHSQIDHINGNRLDNRRSNLREVTNAENAQNKRRARSDNKSGVIGVRQLRQKWQARIMVAGKAKCLGTYATKDQAAAAYIDCKRQLHQKGTI